MSRRTTSCVAFFLWLLAAVAFAPAWLVTAQSPTPPQKPPVFRSGVELLQLDVTVLDKTGRPVRGLTKDDFTLLEDGRPQTIETFAEIDVPEAVHTGPAWSRDVTPDVTSNQIDNKRIFAIVLDDGKGVGGQLGRKNMIETGEGLIDELGPQDLAAIIFTNQVKLSQNLTSDRNKLLTALHRYPLSGSGNGAPSTLIGSSISPSISPARSSGSSAAVGCLSTKETLWTIRAIVDGLSTLPDRRKALIYYTGDVMPWAVTPGDDPCGTYWLWREIFTVAQQGHVSINPIRPKGGTNANEAFMAVAENSGGHAVTVGDVNDVAKGLHQILIENSSYYLLAYPMKPGDADGTYRRLTVKVNRPDVEVVTRRGYWTPRQKPADKPAETPSPEIESIAGILPSAKLNLRASTVVFPSPAGKGQSTIAITVGVTQPAFPTRARETVDVMVKAYSADGDPKGSDSSTVALNVPPTRAGVADAYYEVLSRVDVPKPGKYELRLSAHSSETDERGSIYLDVEVPDFAKAKVSMSGVVLNSALSFVPIAPPRLLNDVAPIAPTAERVFANTDRVSAFLRLYQSADGKLVPLTVRTTIRDAANKTVFEHADTYNPDRFGADRSTDIRFAVPLEKLSSGEHVLTFECTWEKITARRDVVFNVK